MLKGKYLMYGDSLEDVNKVLKSNNFDEKIQLENLYDQDAIYVIIYDNDEPIGCGSMNIQDNIFWFKDINVISNQRNKKVGDFILRLLLEKADLMNAHTVYILCDNKNCLFFEKFGFSVLDNSYEKKLNSSLINNSIGQNKTSINKRNAVYMYLNIEKHNNHRCCNK